MSGLTCPHCKADVKSAIPAGTKRLPCPACGKPILLDGTGQGGAPTVIAKTQEMNLDKQPDDPLVGKVIGGCRILALLGKGAMGSVYKANQESLDRIVALKTIRPELCTEEQFLNRFRQEARTVGRFSTPYVVQIHEVGFDQNLHYLIMEFVGGGSLWNFAGSKPGRRLPHEDAVKFLRQAAEGLMEAERLNIVHRDIKPENLLLDNKGRIKVADFGIAKILGGNIELTMSAALIGTPLYMSPEQATGKDLDHRSDMYSLGASFYHLLTGVPPVEGASVYDCIRKKTEIDCLSPSRIVMDRPVPGPLNGIIEKMTAKEPVARYASFSELVSDLEKLSRGERVIASAPKKKSPVAMYTGIAAVLVLGGGAYFLLGGKGKEGEPDTAKNFKQDPPRNNGPVQDGPKSDPVKPETKTETNTILTPANFETAKTEPDKTVKTIEEPSVKKPDPPEVKTAIPENKPEPRPEPVKNDPPKFDYLAFQRKVDGLQQAIQTQDPTVVIQRGTSMKSELPSGNPESAAYENRIEKILTEAGQQNRILQALKILPLLSDANSANDLYSRWQQFDTTLKAPKDASPEFQSWLSTQRKEYERQSRSRVAALVTSFLQDGNRSLEQFKKRQLGLEDFRKKISSIDDDKKLLLQQFPPESGDWKSDTLEGGLSAYRKAVNDREEQDQKIATLGKDAEGLKRQYSAIRQLSDWTPEKSSELQQKAAQISKSVETLRQEDSTAPLDGVEGSIRDSAEQQKNWEKRVAAFQGAVASFAGHRLSETQAAFSGMGRDDSGDPYVTRLQSAQEAMEQGFSLMLTKLDADGAREQFTKAAESLKGWDGAAKYPDACIARIDEFKGLTRNMAKVSPGEVQLPKESAKKVEAFFLDNTECSIQEYKKFQKDFLQGKSFDQVKNLFADAESFQRGIKDPPYWAENPNLDPTLPVEDVTYEQALAYLRAVGKDLPTLEEWWIAAKGPLKGGAHRKFPWGNTSFDATQERDVVKSAERPVPVTRGGIVIGFSPATVRHLAGNVAEFTKARKPDSKKTYAVGGRYTDTEEGNFTGDILEELDLTDTSRGFGFRGVIRPGEFFKDLVPKSSP